MKHTPLTFLWLFSVSKYTIYFVGICSWIPTGKFTRVYTTVPDSLGSLDVPYSIILMGVGATLAFLAAVILAVSNFDRLIQQPRDVAIQPPKYIMREVVPTQNNV